MTIFLPVYKSLDSLKAPLSVVFGTNGITRSATGRKLCTSEITVKNVIFFLLALILCSKTNTLKVQYLVES